jgi:hypothetical protein
LKPFSRALTKSPGMRCTIDRERGCFGGVLLCDIGQVLFPAAVARREGLPVLALPLFVL